MKKLNKKGFILVETLIVTVFVVTLFILVFQVTVPTMGEYEKIYIYDDIDSVYASNIFKQMLTHYGYIPYIDSNLSTRNYFEITNCNDTNIYSNKDYCNMLKEYLKIGENDHIFVTNYDITNFKNEVRTNEMFDSGSLSNFRDYVNTVPNIEKISANASSIGYDGKYRLFITRTITEADATTSRRYVNIGLYAGSYDKYLMGEKVYFNPINTIEAGKLEFYVLKNSPSTDANLTLILANNLSSSNVCFSNENTSYGQFDTLFTPNTLLSMLKSKTDSWVRVNKLSGYKYVSSSGYTINYNDYRARLIDEEDIFIIKNNVLERKKDS